MKFFDDLKFTMAGRQVNTRNSRDAPPLYYGIQFIVSGEIVISVDHRAEQRVKGPVAFLSCPEFNYNYYTPGKGTRKHYWVCFYGERIKKYVAGGLFVVNPEDVLVRLEDSLAFLEQMNELVDLIQCNRQHGRSVLLLENLLLLMHETRISCAPPRRYEKQFRRLVAQIRKEPEKNWNFAAEARKFAVSLNHFNRLFRSFYKTSPQHFVICRRLEKAADLLITTYYSVAEISHKVGVENELYFSRLFKKRYHVSPKKYRAEFFSF